MANKNNGNENIIGDGDIHGVVVQVHAVEGGLTVGGTKDDRHNEPIITGEIVDHPEYSTKRLRIYIENTSSQAVIVCGISIKKDTYHLEGGQGSYRRVRQYHHHKGNFRPATPILRRITEAAGLSEKVDFPYLATMENPTILEISGLNDTSEETGKGFHIVIMFMFRGSYNQISIRNKGVPFTSEDFEK